MSYEVVTFQRYGHETTALRDLNTGQFVSAKECITYHYLWHAMSDACGQCKRLSGRTWSDQDIFNHTLWDALEGDVWDLDINMPLTHGGTGAHCRCQLEVQAHFDWQKLEELNKLSEVLNMEPKEQETMLPDYQRGSTRETTIEDIGGLHEDVAV